MLHLLYASICGCVVDLKPQNILLDEVRQFLDHFYISDIFMSLKWLMVMYVFVGRMITQYCATSDYMHIQGLIFKERLLGHHFIMIAQDVSDLNIICFHSLNTSLVKYRI